MKQSTVLPFFIKVSSWALSSFSGISAHIEKVWLAQKDGLYACTSPNDCFPNSEVGRMKSRLEKQDTFTRGRQFSYSSKTQTFEPALYIVIRKKREDNCQVTQQQQVKHIKICVNRFVQGSLSVSQIYFSRCTLSPTCKTKCSYVLELTGATDPHMANLCYITVCSVYTSVACNFSCQDPGLSYQRDLLLFCNMLFEIVSYTRRRNPSS